MDALCINSAGVSLLSHTNLLQPCTLTHTHKQLATHANTVILTVGGITQAKVTNNITAVITACIIAWENYNTFHFDGISWQFPAGCVLSYIIFEASCCLAWAWLYPTLLASSAESKFSICTSSLTFLTCWSCQLNWSWLLQSFKTKHCVVFKSLSGHGWSWDHGLLNTYTVHKTYDAGQEYPLMHAWLSCVSVAACMCFTFQSTW